MSNQDIRKLPKREGEILGDRKLDAGIEKLIQYLNRQTKRVSVKELIEASEASEPSLIGKLPIGILNNSLSSSSLIFVFFVFF